MESNTESKAEAKHQESINVIGDTEVEIEDCSDNSENEVAELPTKNKIENTEADTNLDSNEKQDESEVAEATEENNFEGDKLSCNDVPKLPEVVMEHDKERTSASPTPTAAAPVVIEKQNVAESKSEDNEDNVAESEETEQDVETEVTEEGDNSILNEYISIEKKQVKLSENAKTAIDPLPNKPKNSQDQVDMMQPGQLQGEILNNTIKDIISDIDLNIEQESCNLLKQQQKDLLQKQQELVQQIRQQQIIAQQLAAENRLQQQQLQQQRSQHAPAPQQQTQNITTPFEHKPTSIPSQLQENISKYSTIEETKDEFGYTQNKETYEYKESTNASKNIDLHKIFKPATDNDGILPRNRKLYSSSAFYSPALHPTVEDQVELARRISHSLSDISNQKSKGQTMYVNRKKRSVKWVHEGAGQDSTAKEQSQEEFKENNVSLNRATQTTTQTSPPNQVPLRFLMNPLGKVRDITSVSDSFNIETGLLSPDKCAELITALQTQKGKGAELFAKRRRKAENWVVDHKNTSTESPSGLPDYHQQQQHFKPATSPSILPAYSDAGKHRVQLNLHQEQVLEKYVKPGLKVLKTPWEAALETGSASTAFIDDVERSQHTATPTMSPNPVTQYQYTEPPTVDPRPYKNGFTADNIITPAHEQAQAYFRTIRAKVTHNPQRELAYKPSLPQGWKAPSPSLPKELYLPKEISLESYAPPPVVANKDVENFKPSWKLGPTALPNASTFPLAKPSHSGFWSYGQPNSCRTVEQTTSQVVPQINYNPSPLPYDKIAKFEHVEEPQAYSNEYNSRDRHLGVKYNVDKQQNFQPTPLREIPASFERYLTSPYQSNSPTTDTNHIRMPTPTVFSKRINPSEILHAQNYNNTARGWKSSGSYAYKSQCDDSFKARNIESRGIYQQMPLTAANTLPYTDF